MKLFDIHKIIEAVTGYIETKVELLKLDAKEEMTVLISKLFVVMLLALFFTMVLIFISVGAALFINFWSGNSYIGFFIIGLLYALLATILYFNRAVILVKITERQKRFDFPEDLMEGLE